MGNLLQAENTLALATTNASALPTVSPLFYIADAALDLYWISAETTQHSRNVKTQPLASVTIYRPAGNWKHIRGVQMSGSVCAVVEEERRRALIVLYCQRSRLGVILERVIARSTLYVFRPSFVRYIDNSKRFGYKFELSIASLP